MPDFKFTLIAGVLVAVVTAAAAGVVYVLKVRAERDEAKHIASEYKNLYGKQKDISAGLLAAGIRGIQLQQAAADRSEKAASNKEVFRHATQQTSPQKARLSPGMENAPVHPGADHLSVDAVRVLNASAADQAIDRASLGTEEGRAASAATCEAVGETLIETQRMYHDLADRHSTLADAICRSDSAPYNPGCSHSSVSDGGSYSSPSYD